MARFTTHALFAGIATLFLVVGQAQAGFSVDSLITKDTTLYYHDAEVVQHGNFGGYTASDSDGEHYVLGIDNREGSTHDNARPILKAGDIVSDLNFNGVFSSSEISSAELHLFRVQPELHDRTGRTHRVTTGGWVEGDLSFDGWGFEDDAASWISIVHDEVPWNTPSGDYDATELGSFSTTIADATHMEYTVAVTDAVKHWVDNPSENFGVIVVQDVYQGDSTGFFASRDNAQYAPFISVDATPIPEPSGIMLILVGLAAHGWRRRTG